MRAASWSSPCTAIPSTRTHFMPVESSQASSRPSNQPALNPRVSTIAPQPSLNGKQRSLRAIFQLQLGEDRAHVAFDRAFGEMQFVAYLPIAHTASDQVEHAAF